MAKFKKLTKATLRSFQFNCEGPVKLSKIEREEVKMKFGGRCAYCGTPLTDKWHVDHLEPVQRDFEWVRHPEKGFLVAKQTGKLLKPENDTKENLMPSCIKCNLNKSSIPLESWRRMIGDFISGLNRHSKYAMYQHAKRFGLLVEVEGATDYVEFWFEKYLKGEQYIPAQQVISWHKFKDREPEMDQDILVSFERGGYSSSLEATYKGNLFVRNEPWHSTVGPNDMWCALPTPTGETK